jgi:hypothetical protein
MMMLCLAIFSGCRTSADTTSLDLSVGYSLNGKALTMDTLAYVNEAGNTFLVTEVQWFLSHLEMQDEQGAWVAFGGGDTPLYLDTEIPETHHLHFEEVPQGHYTRLRFTFGLDETDNVTGRFPDAPEANMFWPEPLGGGYHYMKLNGKYLTADSLLAPLAIHLGRGQNTELTEFYDNSFVVELPIDLTVSEHQDNTLGLVFNLNNWFRSPHVYDFNVFGSAIMQNQEAQSILKNNGNDVFKAQYNFKMEPPLKIGAELIQKAAPQPHFMTWENIKKRIENIMERL